MPTTSTAATEYVPPGKDCGACGCRTCSEFTVRVREETLAEDRCPFYTGKTESNEKEIPILGAYSGKDFVGQDYDYVITALPGEPTARKVILPFRPDLVDKMGIVKGDIVLGRPAGAGCPVQHVLRVLDADPVTGVITGHVVGPAYSRGKDVKDVRMYHMLGFEGKAVPVRKEPEFGLRQPFLPGFCMMERSHTALCNMVIRKPWGIHVRVEDVVIL